jgi:hypothetical protein
MNGCSGTRVCHLKSSEPRLEEMELLDAELVHNQARRERRDEDSRGSVVLGKLDVDWPVNLKP